MSNYLATFIIPARNRPDKVKRTLKSIRGIKTEKNAFEIIVIDDASTEPTMSKLYEMWKKKYPFNLSVLRFKDHLERVWAFNAGMMQAQGEWIIHLDSDDELVENFKEEFEKMVEENPTANVFNWKGTVVWKDGKVTERPLFKPKMKENGVCEVFKSGQIFSGGFAFRKSCLNVTGYLPQPRKEEATSPYAFGKKFLHIYDEVMPLYTMENGDLKTDIGNPWGQDYALFYMLTRHWIPVSIDKSLHITHVR